MQTITASLASGLTSIHFISLLQKSKIIIARLISSKPFKLPPKINFHSPKRTICEKKVFLSTLLSKWLYGIPRIDNWNQFGVVEILSSLYGVMNGNTNSKLFKAPLKIYLETQPKLSYFKLPGSTFIAFRQEIIDIHKMNAFILECDQKLCFLTNEIQPP